MADVRATLALSGQILAPTRIDVTAQQGTVSLRGGVENKVERYAAAESAQLINGVRDVGAELAIAPSPRRSLSR